MSSCCSTSYSSDGTNRFFSRFSKMYAKQFKKKGLAKEQRLLLDGVKKHPIADATVLDIGCGVGGLHLTLLKEGAARAIGVDMADGMIEKAKTFAEEMGFRDRTEYVLGDFVQMNSPEADIALLDKVVCCYDDLPRLVEHSTSRTRRIYALTHPRDNALFRTLFKTHIAFARLFRWKFRPYWHDWTILRRQVAEAGFFLVFEGQTFAWQVLVFAREDQ
jgi:2-polyprenyl-3-methyl-5-hydroxy-6-metoxy-1,4-benzoquinol methylase